MGLPSGNPEVQQVVNLCVRIREDRQRLMKLYRYVSEGDLRVLENELFLWIDDVQVEIKKEEYTSKWMKKKGE